MTERPSAPEINALLKSSDIYVLIPGGDTIAASNHDLPISFVGENFSYRPYYQDAIRGNLGRFFALGTAPVEDETADIAIRTDHVRIGAMPADGLGFDGIVSNVEYLGAKVKLTVTTAFTDEFTAVLSDAAFFAAPVRVGEGVTLSWDQPDSIVLGRIVK